ncbi:MAG: hypothetical protein WB729_02900 [Candidatus Sulfotelmatobacter sp.]
MSERQHMSHEVYVEQIRHDVLRVIKQAIDAKVRLLLAVRDIYAPLHQPELEKNVRPEDFLFLKVVASECDGLPLGTERQYWAPESLREKDLEIESYERKIGAELLSTLARIADSLSQAL